MQCPEATKLKILGVIPARAGSKRLPGKNLLPLNGKPLIEWTITAAIDSNCLSKIVVSSDDQSALKIANSCGVIGLERPSNLAGDTAKSTDVIDHVIAVCTANNEHFDAVMLLQPTSPLRTAEDIKAALRIFVANNAGSVVAMSECEHSPLLTTKIEESGAVDEFYSNLRNMPHRSQDLAQYYRLNGAIYIAKIQEYLKNRTFFCDPGFAYVMPPERSIDIDNKIDFAMCDVLLNYSGDC